MKATHPESKSPGDDPFTLVAVCVVPGMRVVVVVVVTGEVSIVVQVRSVAGWATVSVIHVVLVVHVPSSEASVQSVFVVVRVSSIVDTSTYIVVDVRARGSPWLEVDPFKDPVALPQLPDSHDLPLFWSTKVCSGALARLVVSSVMSIIDAKM